MSFCCICRYNKKKAAIKIYITRIVGQKHIGDVGQNIIFNHLFYRIKTKYNVIKMIHMFNE